MNYTDVQIKQADAALQFLHYKQTYADGHELYQVMSKHGTNANVMRTKMVNELGLIFRHYDKYLITEDGEKAYEMGFKAWLEESERKTHEPLPVKEVKSESEIRLAKWLAWSGIIGGVAAGIDILLRLLGLF